METGNINNLRIAEDGRVYFLHHSLSSQIKVGEKIRTTQFHPGAQVTASDAIAGHSYAWDARTGLFDAVRNQVSKRGSFRKPQLQDMVDEATDNIQTKEFSVYLTSADSANVYPDINVPKSSARAIKGEQEVLDMVTIPADITDEEAESLIRQMTGRHGISHVEDVSAQKLIDESIFVTKGYEALGDYLEGHGEGVIRGHIKLVKQQLMSGKRRGLYADDESPVTNDGPSARRTAPIRKPHLQELGKIVENEGEEAAFAFAKKEFIPSKIGTNITGLPAEIGSRAIGTTQLMIDKAGKAYQQLLSAQHSVAETSGARKGIMASGTFRKLVESMEVAQNILKGRF